MAKDMNGAELKVGDKAINKNMDEVYTIYAAKGEIEEGEAMNDCVWYDMCICDECTGMDGNKCYLSVNSEKGSELIARYERDVERVLKDIRKYWQYEFGCYMKEIEDEAVQDL